MSLQEVIGKSVKQAAFVPLYTVPERWRASFSQINDSRCEISVMVMWFSFHSVFQLGKHTQTLWTPISVSGTRTLESFLFLKRTIWILDDHFNSWCFHRWNDKKAKMHNVVFCMPEVSPSKLYLLRKETRSNRWDSPSLCRHFICFSLITFPFSNLLPPNPFQALSQAV